MFVLSSDPNQAQRELHGLIFYLATFSYIDGSFDPAEMDFIRKTIWKVVERRINSSSRASDPRQREELVRQYTAYLDRVLEANRRELLNILGGTEAERSHATAQLKERCFEILQSLAPEVQQALLQTVEELLAADGKAHPAELEFRQEMMERLQRGSVTAVGSSGRQQTEPLDQSNMTVMHLASTRGSECIFQFDGLILEVFTTMASSTGRDSSRYHGLGRRFVQT